MQASRRDIASAQEMVSGRMCKQAAILKICKAGSTGPVPTEDVVFAIIDDGSPDADAAFYGAAATGGQAVRLKYDPKGGVKQREKIQEEYQEKGCQCVIAPNTASIFDLMQGDGLECTNCGYGGAAPPRSSVCCVCVCVCVRVCVCARAHARLDSTLPCVRACVRGAA